MGRKPNPLILEYFARGPKLNDNSNRYPHTCKQCGEIFPKGRIDSLTTHITKKCPAISESDRFRACLELHGIANARSALHRDSTQVGNGHHITITTNLPQGWSALETLAEASRQVDLNENSRVQPAQDASNPANPANGPQIGDRFDIQEQFTLENPPVSYDNRPQQTKKAATPQQPSPPEPEPTPELTPEERLQALLPANESLPDTSNISVAVAATARLNPNLLDPQLVPEPTTTSTPPPTVEIQAHVEASPSSATLADGGMSQPWGEMTYLASAAAAPLVNEHPSPNAHLNRGGVRMDTGDAALHSRSRHSRARFTAARRKEVQEVRKIGACIRCRILRKNCGKGTPCDTCRKVLAPRVWRTGCVRTRLHEQLDLYSAGVQVVLSQNRINLLKAQMELTSSGFLIDVSHFPETGNVIQFVTLVALLEPTESQAEARKSKEPFLQVIMIDQDADEVPEKMEKYMRDVLHLFVEREPSKFMRTTLQTALQLLSEGEDDLLRKSIELWGLVESIDRERHWKILERPGDDEEEPRWITETQSPNDADIYTMICMQLNAAAERKANTTSRALLSGMHRILQDSKIKIDFRKFLAAIIFLNCVEKSTWAFKAWEQDHLRPGWPLERDPSAFTQQGSDLAGLLKMLFGIRKALPKTMKGISGKLETEERDPVVVDYFKSLDLNYDSIQSRQEHSQFSPVDSRSLELLFCSQLLLPTPAP